jgi:multidrug resistance efflux pump
MSAPFLRSMRVLEDDTFHRSKLTLLVAIALLGAWFGWFFFAHVALYAISDSADLEVERAAHPIEAQYTGRVVNSRLALDLQVKAGEVLVELDADPQKLQLNEQKAQLAALDPQTRSIQSEITSEENAWRDEQKSAIEALEEARAHYREAEAAARFAQQEAERLRKMYTASIAPELDYNRAVADAEQRQAAADGLRFAISKLEREQRTREGDRLAHIQQLRTQANQLLGQRSTAAAEVARLENEVELRQIRAPIDGKLGEVASLRVGGVVHEGERLASVVPTGTLRIVANFNPPEAVGRIRPGQSARMRLEGFPWTQFGSVSATVTNVASEIRDAHIRVELRVDPNSNVRVRLQHGLPGLVEVRVERISPASLVLRMAGRYLATPRGTTTGLPPGAQP